MLKVAAGQLCDPVLFVVLMKAGDRLFHGVFPSSVSVGRRASDSCSTEHIDISLPVLLVFSESLGSCDPNPPH